MVMPTCDLETIKKSYCLYLITECFFAGTSYKENPHYLLRLLVNNIQEFHRFLTSSGVEAGEIVGEEGAALGRSFIISDPYQNRLLAWSGFHCDSKKDLLKDL